MYFDKENIEELDSETKILKDLKTLSLNHNKIEKIANIPENLKQLSLYYNFTKTIDSKIFHQNMIFLGLGYNSLTDEILGNKLIISILKIYFFSLEKICLSFPNLMTLDMAFNLLIKIDETVENLVKLKNLKSLVLMGNPLCLLKPYKDYVVSQLKLLHYFDQETVNVKENPKEKNGQKSPVPLKKTPSLNTDSINGQV